jgi:serine/threonine protein kinase
VYKALFNGEVVAAKEIEVGSSAEMRESFVTEALLLQNLRHPNIIGFFGLSLTADRGVVLLEYAEGEEAAGRQAGSGWCVCCVRGGEGIEW